MSVPQFANEQQVTSAAKSHLLTNIGVWSPDSKWIVYDTRSSLDGSVFDGLTIERVNVETKQVQQLYQATGGAHCGVATYHPILDRVIFILGPENPTDDWRYGPAHRQGVMVECSQPGLAINLDARDIVPDFTRGALRGGTHVHTFSSDGRLVASTYEDALLERLSLLNREDGDRSQIAFEKNLRGIAISLADSPVKVPATDRRNHSGTAFTILATILTDCPKPGTDEILRACEEGWIGDCGYLRADGQWQKYALAFQGTIVDEVDSFGEPTRTHAELFVLDLPNDPTELMQLAKESIVGTSVTRPRPPANIWQRRITFTQDRRFPGVASQPRHWIRSSANGELIAFLAKDDEGVVQIFGASPRGGSLHQITRSRHSVASAFSFRRSQLNAHDVGVGQIAYIADESVHVFDVDTGYCNRLTAPMPTIPLRPEACVFSPDGKQIAYMRTLNGRNQIFVVDAS